MILAFGIVAYSLVAIGTWRAATGHFAWAMLERKRRGWEMQSYYREELYVNKAPSGETWFGALCIGFVIACLWPLALVFTRTPIRIGAEREAERHQMKERIRELERETGL